MVYHHPSHQNMQLGGLLWMTSNKLESLKTRSQKFEFIMSKLAENILNNWIILTWDINSLCQCPIWSNLLKCYLTKDSFKSFCKKSSEDVPTQSCEENYFACDIVFPCVLLSFKEGVWSKMIECFFSPPFTGLIWNMKVNIKSFIQIT